MTHDLSVLRHVPDARPSSKCSASGVGTSGDGDELPAACVRVGVSERLTASQVCEPGRTRRRAQCRAHSALNPELVKRVLEQQFQMCVTDLK